MHPKALLFALVALFAAFAAPASAAFPPAPAGPIYDGADIIPPQDEAALDARLREYDKRTGNAVIVATVPSLDGDAIEPYAAKLYETWGIGGKERDTGVLLLVAPSERKVRIEVGYGLTPFITDILSGRIIRNDITPRFKAGDLPGGINAGVDAIVTQLDKSPEDAKAIAEAAAAAAAQERSRPKAAGPTIFGVIFWIVMMVVFIGFFARSNGGRRYAGSGGIGSAVGNVVLWTALNAATRGNDSGWGGGGGGDFGGGGGGFGGGGGGFGGFGGGMSGGGGASGSW